MKSGTVVAGHQPNYLPWLGFFDKMRQCDIFILQDALQFEYHGFTNRNRIKTREGVVWLTVPVRKRHSLRSIAEVEVANDSDRRWRARHWGLILANYARARHWKEHKDFLEEVYRRTWDSLLELNLYLAKWIMALLNIDCELVMASTLGAEGRKNTLLVNQCKQLGADVYLSGTGAKAYLEPELFAEQGISVAFQDFTHPVYPQLHGSFVPNLSAIDYLLCAEKYEWSSGMVKVAEAKRASNEPSPSRVPAPQPHPTRTLASQP